MKASINFYLDEFKPKIDWYALKWVALLWAAVLTVTLLLSFFAVYERSALQTRFDDISAKVKSQRELTNSLKAAATEHVESPELLALIIELKRELKTKRKLLKVLTTKEQRDSHGYAGLMYDLAEFANEEIWLTHITYGQRQVAIEGGIKDAAALPVWLEALKKSNYFSGKELTKLTVSNAENSDQYSIFEFATGGQADVEPLSNWFKSSGESK